ncbi:MAG: hypothetical protein R2932_01030 [Caldilineaceae bacterium]
MAIDAVVTAAVAVTGATVVVIADAAVIAVVVTAVADGTNRRTKSRSR